MILTSNASKMWPKLEEQVFSPAQFDTDGGVFSIDLFITFHCRHKLPYKVMKDLFDGYVKNTGYEDDQDMDDFEVFIYLCCSHKLSSLRIKDWLSKKVRANPSSEHKRQAEIARQDQEASEIAVAATPALRTPQPPSFQNLNQMFWPPMPATVRSAAVLPSIDCSRASSSHTADSSCTALKWFASSISSSFS